MSEIDPKAIAVAMAIKRAFEVNATAGSSVNAHPNAFFLNVLGAVDLYKAALSVLSTLEQLEQAAVEKAKQEAKAAAAAVEKIVHDL